MTHAEDQCLSVAAASIISRYTFLVQMKKLGDELNMVIPKGAGEKADEIGLKIVQDKGFDYLNTIAKINFKNIDKIKAMANK